MAVQGIKAVIFDCFGVLYMDSKRSLLDIVPTDRRQELHDLFTSNNYGYFDKETYLKQVSDIVGRSPSEVADYVAHEHQLNSALITMIREDIKPEYKVGLLSNIGREWIEDFFTKNQLHELFDEVVLSGEEGVTKPSSVIFELMASRLGLSTAECLMIDDIKDNCDGAELSGMQAIHFTSNTDLSEELYLRGILH